MKNTLGGRKRLILEAIPYDRWVRAGEIASKVGLTPRNVGIIISWHLLPYHVEKREVDDPLPRTNVYKRCLHIADARIISKY